MLESWVEYANPTEKFLELLAAVGGRGHCVDDLSAAREIIRQNKTLASAARIASAVPELEPGNVDLEQIDDPHELADVGLAIVPGVFAVAENGAVWLDASMWRHRVLPFLAQHTCLVVPAGEICNNMHEAYGRLDFAASGFGLFMSGPSKTADIEQSLVIGAHGARSLTVFLVG